MATLPIPGPGLHFYRTFTPLCYGDFVRPMQCRCHQQATLALKKVKGCSLAYSGQALVSLGQVPRSLGTSFSGHNPLCWPRLGVSFGAIVGTSVSTGTIVGVMEGVGDGVAEVV